ncbi:MAG TPA: alkaline phosphatase D family protein [Trebonia sp.]
MTTGEGGGPALVLGPMLRYVSETEATIWVETDRECQIEILGRTAPTFEVAGHHYGLVVLEGLAPGSEHEYQVALDGTACWPQPDDGFPPSVLRTLRADRPARLAFGSCRVAEIAFENLNRPARRDRVRRQAAASANAAGQAADNAAEQAADDAAEQARKEGTDALAACAAMLPGFPRDRWPDVLLMIGDQVYADEPGPATRRFIAGHRANGRDASAPAGEVADFEEYCALYREAWSDPAVRWLFSVVPTAMIFDDHDIQDDWNTSASWRRERTAQPWWDEHMESAYQSYWVYQHLGNLSPAELAGDETWGKVRGQGDAAQVLADLAHRADQRAPDVRWSFARTFGSTFGSAGGGTGGGTGGKVRVVVLDSRSRRVVDRPRLMADEREWRWLTEAVAGDWEHVVIATSVPPLLPRGIHTVEAWTERICDGAWGRRTAPLGEKVRRRFDLEHWPAFGMSFARLEELLTSIATGRRSAAGRPPATVTLISGDVHHSYLTAVDLPRTAAPAPARTLANGGTPSVPGPPARTSAVYQAVCSPFHQAMPPNMRVAQGLASTRVSGLIGTAAAALAGARAPKLRWRITEGPWFDNMIATLTYDGPKAIVRFDQAVTDETRTPRLSTVMEADLT